jgi:hypothetical protein
MNEHLDEYINDYLNISVSPGYAVMLRGSWGSGKTFYIQNLCKNLVHENRKVVYISLYGLNSTGQIDDAIFAQLHPKLSSKHAKLAGKILTGLAKATIKLDLDEIGASGGSVSVTIPEIDLPDYLSNTNQHIFFFDDLERCEINKVDVLGYINYFVEHIGLKVIVAANEDAINEERDAYFTRKEKVVGCTLEINSDFQSAITSFFNDLSPPSLKSMLTPCVDLLDSIFISANYKNLRTVRQSLLSFQRIFSALSDDAKNSHEFIHELISVYMPLSLEFLSGELSFTQIDSFADGYALALQRALGKNAEKSKVEQLREKYNEMSRALLGDAWRIFWRTFFEKGQVNKNALPDLISSHPLFFQEATPNWKRLWWWYKLTQDEFDEVLESVENEIQEKVYKDIYVVLHVFGTLLQLSENGSLGRQTEERILSNAKLYIKILSKKSTLIDQTTHHSGRLDLWGGYQGLGYPSKNKSFQDLLKFVEEVSAAQATKRKQQECAELLDLLTKNVEDFAVAISELNGLYQSFAVFSQIRPKEFLRILQSFETPFQWYTAAHGIHDRFKYSNVNAYDKYLDETAFFTELNILLDKAAARMRGKIIQDGIKYFKRHAIEHAISQLTACQAELEKNGSIGSGLAL